MLRRLLVVFGCVLLAGCQTGAVPTRVTTVTVSASASGSADPAPSESPSGTPSPSPSASAPSPQVGARDVSAFPIADFASPSGRIWCGLHGDKALCHFPFEFAGSVPANDDVCPGAGIDVAGVEVSSVGSDYFCSGDPLAHPTAGSSQVRWHRGTGFGTVSYESQRLAVLPYGRSLRHGRYACRSERNGVTCVDVRTGRGFRVARAGVVLF